MNGYKNLVGKILSENLKLEPSKLNDFVNSVYFKHALTHKSFSKINNYEYVELRGDCIVNLALTQYIKKRFPMIISSQWLTKIYHKLRGTVYLSKISEDLGFYKYILYNKSAGDVDDKKMLEDCFEAFFGAIILESERKWDRAIGYNLSYTIISNLYDDYNLDLNIENYFDSKSRIKEIYDYMKWGALSPEKEKYDTIRKSYNVKLKSYPLGDRSVKNENIVVISAYSRNSYEEAFDFLYKNALNVMRKYEIYERISDPYKIVAEAVGKYDYPILSEEFRNKIKNILLLCGLNEYYINMFTQNIFLIEFRKCFIDENFDPYNNQDLYSFEGHAAVDCIFISYLTKKLKIYNEHFLTHTKHKLIGKSDIFQKIYEDFEFEKYELYSSESKESYEKYDKSKNKSYRKFVKRCIKSLIGCIVHNIDKSTQIGIGYTAAYKLLEGYADNVKLSSDINQNLSYKTQLKEVYDGLRRSGYGDLKSNLFFTQDPNTKIYTVKITFKGNVIAESSNQLKSDAEENASKIALSKIQKR